VLCHPVTLEHIVPQRERNIAACPATSRQYAASIKNTKYACKKGACNCQRHVSRPLANAQFVLATWSWDWQKKQRKRGNLGTWSWGLAKKKKQERRHENLELGLAITSQGRGATWEFGAGAGQKNFQNKRGDMGTWSRGWLKPTKRERQPGNLELGLAKTSKAREATLELGAGAGKKLQTQRGNLGTWSWGWFKSPK
jgi:hypothetical protein